MFFFPGMYMAVKKAEKCSAQLRTSFARLQLTQRHCAALFLYVCFYCSIVTHQDSGVHQDSTLKGIQSLSCLHLNNIDIETFLLLCPKSLLQSNPIDVLPSQSSTRQCEEETEKAPGEGLLMLISLPANTI